MKKFAMYLLAVLFVLSMTGCSKEETTEVTETVPTTTVATEAPTETETIPAQPTNAQQAEETAMAFATAYFAGDTDTMKNYLTDPYEWSLDTYPGNGTAVSDIRFQGFNGTQVVDEDAENCVASLEFRETAESDSFTYLTMEMTKQQGEWKIYFYTLEG